MPQLTLLHYPDPRLHTVAKAITKVDDRIQKLADDMLETMYAAEGVGLAATQVDVHERLFVMDTYETRDQPLVFINPEIIERSAEMRIGDEGCLSVPDVRDKVSRHVEVTVRALDRQGKSFDLQAQGLAAICIQHEMDHLLGKVFVEYLSLLKRDRIKSKLLKRSRSH
jgi:peptide deformylase